MQNAAKQIAIFLKKNGIDQVFTVTGGGSMFLNKAFNDTFNNICYMHHEQACAMAAEGYARIKNKPALVNVTSGPGGLNALNGVFGAFTDSIPMIIISGQVKNETLVRSYDDPKLRQIGDQEAKIEEIVKPITKYSISIKKTIELATELPKAFNLAISGRPGPVWIDIPSDIQMDKKKINFTIKKKLNYKINKNLLKKILKLNHYLDRSKKPLILAGTGVRLSSTNRELLSFSKKFSIPIATAWTHDLITSNSKYFAGRPGTIGTRAGNFCLQSCDLLIVLGSRLNIRQVGFNFSSFAKNAKIVHVDVDESELNKFYLNTHLKIKIDLKLFFKYVLKFKASDKIKKNFKWLNFCRKISAKYSVKKEIFAKDKPNLLNPYKALFKLSDYFKENDAIVCGNASACIIPFQTIEIKKGQRLFSNSGSASMGYDLPAAIGAAIASKNKKNSRIICFAGDGSLQMNIQELQTLKSLELNIKIFLINNDGYLSIKSTHLNFFGESFGCNSKGGIDFPSFHKIAKAYGLESCVVKDMKSLLSLKSKLDKTKPLFVEIMVDKEQEFCPKLKSRIDDNGKFITPELDDMYPFLPQQTLKKIQMTAKLIT